MSIRHCTLRAFIKRWPVSHVSRRTFADGNASYNEENRGFICEDNAEPAVNDTGILRPITPGCNRELERRARILQAWQGQLEKTELDKESDHGLEQTQDQKPRKGTRNPPIWLPRKPGVRKVKVDVTAAAIAGAVRHYLRPRKGNARVKAEVAAASDVMLQYALSPEYASYRGDNMDLALDEAFQIGKGKSGSGTPERRRIKTVEERREASRRQAERDYKRYAQSIGLRRASQIQPASLNFATAVSMWRTAHLPPLMYDSHARTCRALGKLSVGWVDIPSPKFTKGQIDDFAREVSVFKRIMAERYQRELQQSQPRLHLQDLLLRPCVNIETRLKEILLYLDKILKNDCFRISPIGKDCEVFAQKIDFWIVQYAAMSEDFIPRLGRYVEKMSDEEVTRKVRTFNARAASKEPPYFDPAKYSGTIDPVFWPRTPLLGI